MNMKYLFMAITNVLVVEMLQMNAVQEKPLKISPVLLPIPLHGKLVIGVVN